MAEQQEPGWFWVKRRSDGREVIACRDGDGYWLMPGLTGDVWRETGPEEFAPFTEILSSAILPPSAAAPSQQQMPTFDGVKTQVIRELSPLREALASYKSPALEYAATLENECVRMSTAAHDLAWAAYLWDIGASGIMAVNPNSAKEAFDRFWNGNDASAEQNRERWEYIAAASNPAPSPVSPDAEAMAREVVEECFHSHFAGEGVPTTAADLVDALTKQFAAALTAHAERAREALLPAEPSEELIEATAKALYDLFRKVDNPKIPPWRKNPEYQERLRQDARIAYATIRARSTQSKEGK